MSSKIFLPGLNGIRAIAAISVILSHIFMYMPYYGLPRLNYFYFFANYGVTIFFTLSGFLITYLLLMELEKTENISVKKFYIRRILRIWPLYFLVILIVLGIMKFNVGSEILYYVFIVPNIPFAVSGAGGLIASIPLLNHFWSLGVEEQFYSFWPLVIKNSKKTLRIMTIFFLAYMGLKFGAKLMKFSPSLISVIYYTRFSCLILGAIGAYYFFYFKERLLVFNKIYIEILAWVLLFLMMLDVIHIFSIISHEIVSVFTLILIYNQIANQNVLFSFENKVMDFLGKISFGLYVYHPLIIYLLSLVLVNQFKEYPNSKTLLIFIIVSICSIVVAHFSYEYFEKWFLRFKLKYITVKSAANKQEFNAD